LTLNSPAQSGLAELKRQNLGEGCRKYCRTAASGIDLVKSGNMTVRSF
jgi:hypothetical protein